jgi:hypothetical protein
MIGSFIPGPKDDTEVSGLLLVEGLVSGLSPGLDAFTK